RLHISRLALRHLDHKMPRAVMCSAHLTHLQPKGHTAEVYLTSKVGDGITPFERTSLHHWHGQSSRQISQRRTSACLGGPILGLLLCQCIAFLEPQLLGDTLLHDTEFLQRGWADRCRLKHVGCPVLSLHAIHAEFRQSKNALNEVGNVVESFNLSG